MKSEGMQHLNEDQIIQAIVDVDDLPQSVQKGAGVLAPLWRVGGPP